MMSILGYSHGHIANNSWLPLNKTMRYKMWLTVMWYREQEVVTLMWKQPSSIISVVSFLC